MHGDVLHFLSSCLLYFDEIILGTSKGLLGDLKLVVSLNLQEIDEVVAKENWFVLLIKNANKGNNRFFRVHYN